MILPLVKQVSKLVLLSLWQCLGIMGVDTRVSPGLAFLTLPLSAAANANRYLLSALSQQADLFLPQPISVPVGDKLYEASIGQTQVAIEELQEEVEFPDLRLLVNEGEIGFQDVLLFGAKPGSFANGCKMKQIETEALFSLIIRKSRRK